MFFRHVFIMNDFLLYPMHQKIGFDLLKNERDNDIISEQKNYEKRICSNVCRRAIFLENQQRPTSA